MAGAWHLSGRHHAWAGPARADRRRDARSLPGSDVAAHGQRQPGRRDDPQDDRGAALCRPRRHRAPHGQGDAAVAAGAAGSTRLRGGRGRCLARGQPAFRQGVPEAVPGGPGAEAAERGAQAVAGYRQPDPARDASLGAVPRRPGRAVAPWHDVPAGRAGDDREHGRARGPADAQRGRRGPPLGAGAQAPGARAREGECCGRAAQRPASPRRTPARKAARHEGAQA